jgi:hypothetical protein
LADVEEDELEWKVRGGLLNRRLTGGPAEEDGQEEAEDDEGAHRTDYNGHSKCCPVC